MGFGKDGKGVMIREDTTHTLGTLAAATGILVTNGGMIDALQEDFRILKTEGSSAIQGLTAGEGGLSLYMINGELSLAEAEAAIELNGPQDRNDRVSQEFAGRWVRFVGVYVPTGNGAQASLHGTGSMDFKPRWTFSDPEAWNWMVYSNNAGPITTGAIVRQKLTHFGVWVT